MILYVFKIYEGGTEVELDGFIKIAEVCEG